MDFNHLTQKYAHSLSLSVAKNIDNRMYVGAYAWPYAWPNLRETFRSCWGMVGE